MRRELATMVVVALAVTSMWACGGQTLSVGGDAGGDGGSSSGGSSGGSSGSSSGSSSGGSSGGSSGSSSGSSSGGSSGGSSGSSSGGNHEVPVNHRTSDAECLQPAPVGNCQNGSSSGGPPGMCGSDSQCTAGKNGRCVESGGGVLYCACTYDTCADDAACPTGQTCACHGSIYNGAGNTCMPGNCRVDTDCEGGAGYCSPAYATMGCGGLAGYYCHTPQDQCVNDTDCQSGYVCTYATSSSRWTCQQQLLCG